jgi:hypothetical protein
MAHSKDILNWFLQHCTKFHYLLETDVPMYDVALMIIKHIIGLHILFVSNKVLDDVQKTISTFAKSKARICNCAWNRLQIILCNSMQMINSQLAILRHCMSPLWQLQKHQCLWFLGSNMEQQRHLLSLVRKILH